MRPQTSMVTVNWPPQPVVWQTPLNAGGHQGSGFLGLEPGRNHPILASELFGSENGSLLISRGAMPLAHVANPPLQLSNLLT